MAFASDTSTTLADGIISSFTHAELEAAMATGGTVEFSGPGTVLLTNTIAVTQNTTLQANGHEVTISGGDAVRLFGVHTNVSFRVEGITLANGRVLGTPATTNSPGGDAIAGAILSQGGSITLLDCVLRDHVVRGGDATNAPSMKGGEAKGAAIWSKGGSWI